MKSSRFETVLDECLARLEAGESLTTCLEDYPQHAGELGALLGVAQAVQLLPPPPINRRQYQAGKSLMLARAGMRPRSRPAVVQRWSQIVGQLLRPAVTGGLALAGVALLALWVYSLSNGTPANEGATALAMATVLPPATEPAAAIAVVPGATGSAADRPVELPPPNITVVDEPADMAASEAVAAPATSAPTTNAPAAPAPTSTAAAGLTAPVSNAPAGSCGTDYFFAPAPAGCPRFPAQTASGASQPFEHGQMVWLPNGDLNGAALIYVLYDNGLYDVFVDSWQDGDLLSDEGLVVPAGFYQPLRGFGLIWREQPGVADALGWALAPESSQSLLWQDAQPAEAEFPRYLQLDALTTLRLSHAQHAGVWELVP